MSDPQVSKNDNVILPGSTIGILGSGQLGRMLALKARRMGYRVHTFSPDQDSLLGRSPTWATAGYDDLDRLRSFACDVDVVTFEFENVPSAATEAIEAMVPVRPHGSVLHTTQNRLREKNFFKDNDFPCADFREVKSLAELKQAIEEISTPCVLKTAGFGYDGKGQAKIATANEAEAVWEKMGEGHYILEAFIPFTHEASVVAARGQDGSFVHYGLMENVHKNHILDVTLSPGRFPDELVQDAFEIAQGVLERLDVVGVMCVEFFVVEGNTLLINELAPRPHNSGHITFDNAVTCQFEQQLRAVTGMPLGSTERTILALW